MRILVVGSGGREHAILWKLRQSPRVEKLYCAPGNGGMRQWAEIVDISVEDIEGLCQFAKKEAIGLTIVGPEASLVQGIVDRFQKEGLRIIGPDQACAQLEGSKVFAKEFMMRHHIPTARYQGFENLEDAVLALKGYDYPVVIKADGLAAGKGVVIVENEQQAIEALREMMEDKRFGEAGDQVVIEEFLVGTEASVLCFVDGECMVPMVSAQDYKRAFTGDEGPNTGGMGTYSPSHYYDDGVEKAVREQVLLPVMEGLKKDRLNFKGILFIGLMLTNEGPKVLEFNTRFGDPETQVILTRLNTDLLEIFEGILSGNLRDQTISWSDQKTVCVVLTSGGYPGEYEKGKEIRGLDQVDSDVYVFHSGTKWENNQMLTWGGRVLGITASATTVEEAREKAYNNVEKIFFEGIQYRKDIGKRR